MTQACPKVSEKVDKQKGLISLIYLGKKEILQYSNGFWMLRLEMRQQSYTSHIPGPEESLALPPGAGTSYYSFNKPYSPAKRLMPPVLAFSLALCY